MATLVVSSTSDFSADTLLDIDQIAFVNTTLATATFASSQFDGVSILDDVTISANSSDNRIVVYGSVVTASRWQFQDWDSYHDSLKFSGTGGNDRITGTVEDDIIRGGNGSDILKGGDGNDDIRGGSSRDILIGGLGSDTLIGNHGNDSFIFRNGDNAGPFELIHGGQGNHDRIVLDSGGGAIDLRDATIYAVEEVVFKTGGEGTFRSWQIGQPFGVITIIGSSETDRLNVIGDFVYMVGVTFENWFYGLNNEFMETVYIAGTDADSDLTGSIMDDLIFGNGGADQIDGQANDDYITPGLGLDASYGGQGDDTFLFHTPGELENFEIVDGGTDVDTIVVIETDIDGTYDLRLALPANIEKLTIEASPLSDTTTTVTFTADYLGANGITEVTAKCDTVLDVEGPNINISTVSFLIVGIDTELSVILRGDDTANTIIGSVAADQIDGREGDDVIEGGGGDDLITGGLGRDEMTGGAGHDVFIYLSTDDTPTGATRDRIDDFAQNEDVIQFTDGLGYTFLGLDAFTASGAAEINYLQSATTTIVQIDGDGDGSAEAKIALTGLMTLTSDDFILS